MLHSPCNSTGRAGRALPLLYCQGGCCSSGSGSGVEEEQHTLALRGQGGRVAGRAHVCGCRRVHTLGSCRISAATTKNKFGKWLRRRYTDTLIQSIIYSPLPPTGYHSLRHSPSGPLFIWPLLPHEAVAAVRVLIYIRNCAEAQLICLGC